MRATMVSLLLTVFLTAGASWYYFRHAGFGTADGHAEVVSTTGVKLDLATIAHAEQAYYSLHGSYGKLDQLDSTGVVDKTPKERDGFVYAVETSHDGFLVTASRKDPAGRASKVMIDHQMKVREELTEQ